MRDRDLRDGAVSLDDVDGAPVGDGTRGELGHLRQRLPVVERRASASLAATMNVRWSSMSLRSWMSVAVPTQKAIVPSRSSRIGTARPRCQR